MLADVGLLGLALAAIIFAGCFAIVVAITAGLLIDNNKLVVGKQKKRVAKAEADFRVTEWKEREAMAAAKRTAIVTMQHRLALGEGDTEQAIRVLNEEERNRQRY